ncbi:phosphatidylserine synthase [Mesonia sp. K7]|nr:CDP-alcohol phosphatidyltransferase family protein [Mesonia sp. K7]PZD79702.1 phosphatidylserine synthase [Mesonia sp. K7]
MKKHIPNLITLLNLLCGSIAVVLTFQNELVMATAFVFLGIFLDFFDGIAARVLDARSELGLQLDSLADLVTSGLVPSLVVFQLINHTFFENNANDHTEWNQHFLDFNFDFSPYALFAFLIVMGSAYRLANFNVDDRQTTSFRGIPTPANAMMIMSLPLILEFQSTAAVRDFILNPTFLIVLSIFSCWLLNSGIPIFAFKFKNLNWKENWFRFVFVIIAALALIFLKFIALPFIILAYVCFSLLMRKELIE